MKIWFYMLDDIQKRNTIFLSWIATILSFFLSAAIPFFSYVFIACLVVSILFTKWRKNAGSRKNVSLASVETKKEDSFAPMETEEEKEIKKRREEFLQKKLNDAKEELDSLPRCPITISTEKRKRRTGYEDPTFSNVTVKGNYNEFVVFDTETTGLTPSRDRIIELAGVRFVDGKPTEIFETFINPERPISPEVTAINHITDEMVANAPTIAQVLPAFEEFVGNSPLVAHNMTFDLKFIYYSGSNLMEQPRKYFDTYKVVQKVLKKPQYKYDREYDKWEKDYNSDYNVNDYKLGTLAEYYKIPFPDSHRAVADAIVTGKVFLKLVDDKLTYLTKRT